MTSESTLERRRAAIDDRIEGALEVADDGCLAPVRTAIRASDDRWYGQLVTVVYEATADDGAMTDDGPTADDAVPAAAAIELLRAYCRLRADLLADVRGVDSRSSPDERTAALLAGDHLYASAFATVREVHAGPVEACIETLSGVSSSIVEAFAVATNRPTDPRLDHAWLVDHSAGVLGEGAAVVGSALGGVEASRRGTFASVGRGFAAAREVGSGDDGDVAALRGVAAAREDCGLGRHGNRRRRDAERALEALPEGVDAAGIRTFVERTVG